MNQSPVKINVIKPGSKWQMPWGNKDEEPKVAPVQGVTPPPKKSGKVNMAVVVVTVLLAVTAVGGATMLFFRQRLTPTPGQASTTQTIVDNFDSAPLNGHFWTETGTGPGTHGNLVFSGGKLNINVNGAGQYRSEALQSIDRMSGDFSAELDVDSVTITNQAQNRGLVKICINNANTSFVCIQLIKFPDRLAAQLAGDGGTLSPEHDLGASTSTKIKLVRVGNVAQGFVDSGAGYQLIGTLAGVYAGEGNLQIIVDSATIVTGSVMTAIIDNFFAAVNIVGLPTPPPGTPEACEMGFTVLSIVATSTPSPTPPPGATPTPSPTPVPNATVTPTPTPSPTPVPGATVTPTSAPNACGGTCGSNYNCQSGMFCYEGFCRNPDCPTEGDCTCGLAAGPSPTTPTTLVESGTDMSWWVVVGGAALVLLAGVMLIL